MTWLWVGLGLVVLLTLSLALMFHRYIVRRFLPHVVRIFQEKPLLIPPMGRPFDDAEDVEIPTPDGLLLRGCYLTALGERRGVILFGLEYGSNRWSCLPYCEFLRHAGYDIFAFEPRGQAQSPAPAGYSALQWVTSNEVEDFRTTVRYLRHRPDADPRGIGFFGLSKGASAGLLAAADEPYLRSFVTDGLFAAFTTMVPYMRKWVSIYSQRKFICDFLPLWYYRLAARIGLRMIENERGCTFPHLEKALPLLGTRPLLMIHGAQDNYIRPEMAQELFEMALEPKELWLVPNAKHNQAIHQAGDEYKQRVLAFFDEHLAQKTRSELFARSRRLDDAPAGVV
ncbi:MAG: alpha/beta hydrolase [Gemmataceae bacterium]|nr:alpha/beta hydrolase [Gemmataceae bacterium]